MSDDNHDDSDNPYRPRTLKVRDPLHDAQLLRDMAIINAQTVKRLGPLPPGGLPVQPKRKPNLPQHPPVSAADPTEDDPMKLHQLAAAAIVPLAMAAAGCSHRIDAGSVKAQLNPHPQKRYEVTATADAPGEWDSVKGYISYEVINPQCTPEDKFLGVHKLPQDVGHDIEMVRVDEKTWKGFFYRDLIHDEDYYGLGVCHWDATNVAAVFNVHNEAFNSGDELEDLLVHGPQALFFSKEAFEDRSLTGSHMPGFLAVYPKRVKNPFEFFSISISVREMMP